MLGSLVAGLLLAYFATSLCDVMLEALLSSFIPVRFCLLAGISLTSQSNMCAPRFFPWTLGFRAPCITGLLSFAWGCFGVGATLIRACWAWLTLWTVLVPLSTNVSRPVKSNESCLESPSSIGTKSSFYCIPLFVCWFPPSNLAFIICSICSKVPDSSSPSKSFTSSTC